MFTYENKAFFFDLQSRIDQSSCPKGYRRVHERMMCYHFDGPWYLMITSRWYSIFIVVINDSGRPDIV